MRIDVTAILAGLGAAAAPFAAVVVADKISPTMVSLAPGSPSVSTVSRANEALRYRAIGAVALVGGALLAYKGRGAYRGAGVGVAVGSLLPFLMGEFPATPFFENARPVAR